MFINTCMYEVFCFILGDKPFKQVPLGCYLRWWPCWDEHMSGLTWPFTSAWHSDMIHVQASPQTWAELLIAPAHFVLKVNQHCWLCSRGSQGHNKGVIPISKSLQWKGQVILDTWKHQAEAFCLCYPQLPAMFSSCVWKFVCSSSLSFPFLLLFSICGS